MLSKIHQLYLDSICPFLQSLVKPQGVVLSTNPCTVAPETSPLSPLTVSYLTLYFLFHFSNHSLEPLNSSFPRRSAISFPFATSCFPPGYIFLEQASRYHLYNTSFTSLKSDFRVWRLTLQDFSEALLSYKANNSSFCFKSETSHN